MTKKAKDTITINKKVFLGIFPTLPIFGVLLSKGQTGPLMLFIIGIVCGIIIGRFWKN